MRIFALEPDNDIKEEIQFYGEDILRGNWLFKHFILKPDTVAGIKSYELYMRNYERDEGSNPSLSTRMVKEKG